MAVEEEGGKVKAVDRLAPKVVHRSKCNRVPKDRKTFKEKVGQYFSRMTFTNKYMYKYSDKQRETGKGEEIPFLFVCIEFFY